MKENLKWALLFPLAIVWYFGSWEINLLFGFGYWEWRILRVFLVIATIFVVSMVMDWGERDV